MAGILRALHQQKRRHVPYFKALSVVLLAVTVLAQVAPAQTANRQEGILIDISGSIGAGSANSDLFSEYLLGTKRLLETEPPSSRVIVSLITTESFGSARELLKGWTPEARGVFTDNLNRARHELSSSFEKKAQGLTPIAAGTDIFGALWRMKALMENGTQASSATQRDIWILSDMVNETPALHMPALIAAGPERMVEQAKANGLLVPLKGYRIHVVGASPRSLTPKAWNGIKEFWKLYFQAAGADLVLYSPDSVTSRE